MVDTDILEICVCENSETLFYILEISLIQLVCVHIFACLYIHIHVFMSVYIYAEGPQN